MASSEERIAELVAERDRALHRIEEVTHAREALLASISHDLRNPLNTFAMSAGLLRDDVEHGSVDNTRALALLSRMERAVERMQRLIEDLVEASRVDARKVELRKSVESVERVVRDSIAAGTPIASERNAKIEQGDVDKDARVNVDGQRIAQAMGKLFGYSIRIVGDGGTARISAQQNDGAVQIAIEATPAQGSSFSPPEEGRGGLSLLLARGLVELHSGSLSLEATTRLLLTVALPSA